LSDGPHWLFLDTFSRLSHSMIPSWTWDATAVSGLASTNLGGCSRNLIF
jgi:hypothetical protein